MADTDRYVNSRFTVSAKIGEVEFPDIVGCSASFALNTIPICSLTVATGREMSSNKPATIHAAKTKLRSGDEAVVTLTIRNTDGATGMMETGTFVIFRGKYAGMGYKRTYGSAGYTLHLVHWLDNLNQGSMINGNWFPNAPYDLAQAAGTYALTNTEGTAGLLAGMQPLTATPALDVNNKFITYYKVSTDFWGNSLLPLFKSIAQWPTPRYQGNDFAARRAEQAKPVLEALDRMSPTGPGQKWYARLALDLLGLHPATSCDAIKRALVKDGINSFGYSTFWNKLAGEYAPQFLFALSPAVDFALAVPFFAGLRQPHKTILSSEYNYADFNASVLQQIESVDIFYPATGETGFIRPAAGKKEEAVSAVSFRVPLGFYPPIAAQNVRGFKMLKEPPSWMTNLFHTGVHGAQSTGVTGNLRTTVAPTPGQATPPPDRPGPAAGLGDQQRSYVAMRFAEHWYKTEVLSQRQGEMSGKLRFDIAPGSIIGIETSANDIEAQDTLYATVTQVSYAIDAERGEAGTSFGLSHIRTSAENELETLTADAPKLYIEAWKGAPLAVPS
jgi:hypothetical protein